MGLRELAEKLSDEMVSASLDDAGRIQICDLYFLIVNTTLKALGKYACEDEEEVDEDVKVHFVEGVKEVAEKMIYVLSNVHYQEFYLDRIIEKAKKSPVCPHCKE